LINLRGKLVNLLGKLINLWGKLINLWGALVNLWGALINLRGALINLWHFDRLNEWLETLKDIISGLKHDLAAIRLQNNVSLRVFFVVTLYAVRVIFKCYSTDFTYF